MYPLTSSYFTDEALAYEKKLFKTGYVGTELWASISGAFHVLPWDEGRMLINDNGVHKVMSNRCLHRQATMLEGSGQLKGNIICPLHLWSYRTAGDLVKAPRFAETPKCKLQSTGTLAREGYLFEPGNTITSCLDELGERLPSLAGYQLRSVEAYPRRSNWKTFMG
jgi:phenylpropionate dioxygenase-like ring-hydroxylating dioxygenase large terminal subunit